MSRAEHVFVPMADGIRLAATLYFPTSGGPWPAVMEALPYRKDDITASYEPEYQRLADAGYVVCRVDVRGTGSSEGIAEDEYPAVERSDLMTVIDWLATRDWSTGAVGMYGTSYSGFNSIQLAMERPPALRAIIPIFATDDRYADDVHYFGGALKGVDQVDYPTYMIAMNALPPVPAIYGQGWRELWLRRIEETEPWILRWLEHQRFDEYWQYGSLRPDYGAIEVPTMIVAGWADGYRNNSLRTFEALRCPKRLIAGPWSHAATDTGVPGPNADLIPEHLRWWDRWLKGIENGVDSEPPIVLFGQRSTAPGPTRPAVNGEWRYEPAWPAERLAPRVLRLADAEGGGDRLQVCGDTGWTAWISCAAALPWGQPDDQRPDEAFSLVHTWPELAGDLEILGHATLDCEVRASAPVAYLSAKLCDVAPDGSSTLVTRGLLNLAHRDSREQPSPLVPGRPVSVRVELEAMSWTFAAGHRLRLDLAGGDWPNAWAPPRPMTLEIDPAGAELTLPVLDGPSPVSERPQLAPPRPETANQSNKERPKTADDPGWVRWTIERDQISGETHAHAGSFGDYPASGAVPSYSELYGGTVSVHRDDPGRSRSVSEGRFVVRFPEAECESHARMTIESDAEEYRIQIELVAREDGAERGHRRWDLRIPRDHQ